VRHWREVDGISRQYPDAEKGSQALVLQEAALAIEVLEALNVHHKVQDFETSQDELLYVLLTACSDLRVH
jgi:hypothetical protein